MTDRSRMSKYGCSPFYEKFHKMKDIILKITEFTDEKHRN